MRRSAETKNGLHTATKPPGHVAWPLLSSPSQTQERYVSLGRNCRENTILCDLADVRGELLQVLLADPSHFALTTGQCALRITWRALDPKIILPTADVFFTPTTISSTSCSLSKPHEVFPRTESTDKKMGFNGDSTFLQKNPWYIPIRLGLA